MNKDGKWREERTETKAFLSWGLKWKKESIPEKLWWLERRRKINTVERSKVNAQWQINYDFKFVMMSTKQS